MTTTDLSSLASSQDLTFTQFRLVQLLADGKVHTRFELCQCLRDELGTVATMRVHVCVLRKKLKPQGYNIHSETISGECYYRLARIVSSPHE